MKVNIVDRLSIGDKGRSKVINKTENGNFQFGLLDEDRLALIQVSLLNEKRKGGFFQYIEMPRAFKISYKLFGNTFLAREFYRNSQMLLMHQTGGASTMVLPYMGFYRESEEKFVFNNNDITPNFKV